MPLTEERFADLVPLFEEGGDPKWCWCQWFRTPAMDWTNSSRAQKREELRASAAGPGPAPGLVGYRDGNVVGWISLGPRESYARLTRARLLAPVDDRPVWSIVCFVVSRRARGSGVGHALLRAGIDYAQDHGAMTLEAYPVAAERGRVSAASAYQGTQSMFRASWLRGRRGPPMEQRQPAPADHAPGARVPVSPRNAPRRLSIIAVAPQTW